MQTIVFIDSEIELESGKIFDLGAVKPSQQQLHSANTKQFEAFVAGSDFICGHNTIAHDMTYPSGILPGFPVACQIDTLPLSLKQIYFTTYT